MAKKRTIQVLYDIIRSQKPDPGNWPKLRPEVCKDENGIHLKVKAAQVGFLFDDHGEQLLGIYNWKDD